MQLEARGRAILDHHLGARAILLEPTVRSLCLSIYPFITSLTSQHTADLPQLKIGEEDDRVTQIFASQKHLAAKYQELETLVKKQVQLWQERDVQWTQKSSQDTHWRTTIDGKLQTILNVLGQGQSVSQPIPIPSQPVLF
jgi:hypothetical protein